MGYQVTAEANLNHDLSRCAGIRVDVTGNCNLRCPYCINDFSGIRGNTLMDSMIFERVVRILPLLLPDGELLFSCFFEPTLHPRFLEFLEHVPLEFRRQAAFTTNLGKPLSEQFFEKLSRLELHHINVSLDSLSLEVFEEMRKGARFSVFQQNLDKLVDAFSKAPDSPQLHFITMLSKLNLEEIPELVKSCLEKFGPSRHEVRAIWMTEEIATRPWIQEKAMTLEDSLRLRESLENAPPHVELVYDLHRNPDSYTPFPVSSEVGYQGFLSTLNDPNLIHLHTVPLPLILRITSDGKLGFLMPEPGVSLDLNGLEDPYDSVKQIVYLQNLNIARAKLLQNAVRSSLELKRLNTINEWLRDKCLKLKSIRRGSPGCLDDLRPINGQIDGRMQMTYLASGWAGDIQAAGPANEVVLIASQGRKRWAVAIQQPEFERPDVARATSNPRFLYSGWKAQLHLEPLLDKLPGRFRLAAYVLDSNSRKAFMLEGSHDVLLG